ncbi:MAG TPA: amino acid ABC transporter substrate-binding protein [Bradyrhizobium sp.]|uniref:amino acid ABC transporter substrate-binding protein n=1 Tax=Bradyrhizobium sp. TaxID=376 RepID=UPI002D80C361|nr:amino acid ABC transporter substrate-binding protein [Bradyrhizobium sp.]HET7889564.1 amino acid ABC transporter substrate-binding protein [Bradyrhizobium sp.]
MRATTHQAPSADRRGFLAAGAAGVAALLAASPTKAADAAEDTLDKIKNSGVMNIGIREAAPPYGFKDANGEYQGFATDIGKAIYAAVNKELGGAIKLNYVAVTSQTRIPLLQNGAIDLEAGATVMTIGRSRVVDFSIPHFVTSTSVLVLAGSPIKEVADLAGKRVGIPQGGLEAALYKTANEAGSFTSPVKTIGFPDHSQGITALQTGTVDAYSSDEPILYDVGRDRSQFRIVPLKMNAATQTLLIRPGSSKFKRIADQTIAQLCSSGEWEKLYQRYFGEGGFKMPLPEAGKFLVQMNSWPA